MLGRPRKLISGARGWLRSNWRPATAIAVAAATLAGAGVYLVVRDDSAAEIVEVTGPAPAPEIVVRDLPAPEQTDELGFPEFATKNTTRVAGADPVADAAGVALAVYPSTGELAGPDAVTLVDTGEWAAAIAATSLVAEPVRAPILFTADGDIPALTTAAIDSLGPSGSKATGGDEVFVVGAAAEPPDLKSAAVEGSSPAGLAAAIAALRVELGGRPEHVVLASADEPALAMPAASWAARSGDPVLYLDRDRVPAATREALESFKGLPVYILGPEEAISEKVLTRFASWPARRLGSRPRAQSRARSSSPATQPAASGGTSTIRGTVWCSPTRSGPWTPRRQLRCRRVEPGDRCWSPTMAKRCRRR